MVLADIKDLICFMGMTQQFITNTLNILQAPLSHLSGIKTESSLTFSLRSICAIDKR